MRRHGEREEAVAERGGDALRRRVPARKLAPPQRKEAGRGGGFVVKAAAPGLRTRGAEAEAGGGLDGEPAEAGEGAALAVAGAKQAEDEATCSLGRSAVRSSPPTASATEARICVSGPRILMAPRSNQSCIA